MFCWLIDVPLWSPFSVLAICWQERRGPWLIERGCLNGESAPSRDGSVCSVSRCLVVSLGGSAKVMFSSLGFLMLGVASPVFMLGIGLVTLVPLAQMLFFF